jgi:hypothetical protein
MFSFNGIKKLSAVLFGTAFLTLSVSGAAKGATLYTNRDNGNKYYLTDSGTWFGTRYQATTKFGEGDLVTIDDANEQNWLWDTFGMGKLGLDGGQEEGFWIGLTDAGSEGNFQWVSGAPLDYTEWWPGEPSNSFSGEDYIMWNHVAGVVDRDPALRGAWNDENGSNFRRGIAEIDPLYSIGVHGGDFTSIIFQDSGDWRIPGWDHVALNFNGWIYESTLANNYGNNYPHNKVWDADLQAHVVVDYENGVQNSRSIDVFKKWPDAKKNEQIEIDSYLAYKMAQLIEGKLNADYQYISGKNFLWSTLPGIQKGGGGKFSCVGLIEWAAEQAGLNGGQGFIPNNLEYIELPSVNPFLHPFPSSRQISTLTPSLIYHALDNPDEFNKGSLHGLFDPVDFILTDPLGHRLGYTQELGLLEEIPGAFYTGDGWAEPFLVSGLNPGNYILQLFGLDDQANVAFGNSTGGSSFSGYLAKGETHTMTFTVPSKQVPEPRTIIGTAITGAFMAGMRKKYKKSTVAKANG